MFRRSQQNKNVFDKSSIYSSEEEMFSNYNFGSLPDSVEVVPAQKFFDTAQQTSQIPSTVANAHEEIKWETNNSRVFSHNLEDENKENAPDTTLGENVTFKGELEFEKLLKIDGSFEGTLSSKGKLIVGPKGSVKADINLSEAIIEGNIEGNITISQRLVLKGNAVINGDITANSLSIEEGVTILGFVKVSKTAVETSSNLDEKTT